MIERLDIGRRGFALRTGMVDDAAGQAAYAKMMQAVFGFGMTPSRFAGLAPIWTPFALFEERGRCVAGAEVADLDLLADGILVKACGVRRVGVDPSWRRRGLFKELMQHVIAGAEQRGLHLMLLYTEDPALYQQFGFASVAQHAFTGRAPEAATGNPSHPVDLAHDQSLVERLLAARGPPSHRIALTRAPGLFLENASGNRDLQLAYLAEADALLVYEMERDTLVLVDVVAAHVPSLTRILAAMPHTIGRATTLFPPDLLDWNGEPVADDTGLMARGPLPSAMERPFRLPPTTEF